MPATAPSAVPNTIETTDTSRVRSVAAPIRGKYWGICSQCQVYTERSGGGLLHPGAPRHLHEPRIVEGVPRAARPKLEDREIQPVAEFDVPFPHGDRQVLLREGFEHGEGAVRRLLRADRDVGLVVHHDVGPARV